MDLVNQTRLLWIRSSFDNCEMTEKITRLYTFVTSATLVALILTSVTSPFADIRHMKKEIDRDDFSYREVPPVAVLKVLEWHRKAHPKRQMSIDTSLKALKRSGRISNMTNVLNESVDSLNAKNIELKRKLHSQGVLIQSLNSRLGHLKKKLDSSRFQ